MLAPRLPGRIGVMENVLEGGCALGYVEGGWTGWSWEEVLISKRSSGMLKLWELLVSLELF